MNNTKISNADDFINGTSIEIINPKGPENPPEHAVFDFDGTISLIREGWMNVMISYMTEILASVSLSEPRHEIEKNVSAFVTELTGKQTIYQMLRLADEVSRRGSTPKDPLEYKKEYNRRLLERIANRREGLRSGKIPIETMIVPFAIEMLEALKKRGIKLYLASGTDREYVIEEAGLLGLGKYFGENIYGAIDDYKSFSKKILIDKILSDNSIDGSKMVIFGDGYVEIENAKSAGGTAIAVASDETGKSGKPDPWKRERLIHAGADIVIPDYRDYEKLLKYLWNEINITE